jgi:hypothetical protein
VIDLVPDIVGPRVEIRAELEFEHDGAALFGRSDEISLSPFTLTRADSRTR